MTDSSWRKGRHGDHDAFVIEVLVRRDRAGRLTSRRRLQSQVDEEVAAALPAGGMAEGGWALLTEAARTETTLQLLVKLSNEPSFQENLLRGDSPSAELIEKLTRDVESLIQRELREILPHVAREVTETIRDGLRSETG